MMKLRPWNQLHKIGEIFVQNLKDSSNITLKLWVDHCEYILAQRFRRGQQIATFYHRIWGDHALKELLKGFRKQVQRHARGILLSSVGLYAFDWDSERIRYDNVRSYFLEIDFVKKLQKETLMCVNCKKRRAVGEKFDGIDYCVCKLRNEKNPISASGWEVYIERKNMVIWRKEERSSLYSYKVYAKYNDINANDFLQVQTDVKYRKEWDDTAVSLDIIDTDPLDKLKSHVIYWEMRWPKLFANRDYVYSRRYFIDKGKKLIVICNKSTKHPQCPVKPEKQRVHEYWSYMLIKPFSNFKEPGLEFVLTYFDDPGLTLPATITSWVAQKQMPDFLNKLYMATKKFAERKKQIKSVDMFSSWEKFSATNKDKDKDKENETHTKSTPNKNSSQAENEGCHDENANTPEENEVKRSWWSYLYPNYLFA